MLEEPMMKTALIKTQTTSAWPYIRLNLTNMYLSLSVLYKLTSIYNISNDCNVKNNTQQWHHPKRAVLLYIVEWQDGDLCISISNANLILLTCLSNS